MKLIDGSSLRRCIVALLAFILALAVFGLGPFESPEDRTQWRTGPHVTDRQILEAAKDKEDGAIEMQAKLVQPFFP